MVARVDKKHRLWEGTGTVEVSQLLMVEVDSMIASTTSVQNSIDIYGVENTNEMNAACTLIKACHALYALN